MSKLTLSIQLHPLRILAGKYCAQNLSGLLKNGGLEEEHSFQYHFLKFFCFK